MAAIRLALIGAGLHATGQHLPALLDHERQQPGSVQVVAVCDRDRARAAAAAPAGTAVYDDWRVCLASARPDAVLACVPPALTPEICLAAAAAGAAVWVEKPLAPTLAGAEALCAGLAGARAMASMNRRFEPAIARLRALTAGRSVCSVRAVMARGNRREADFLAATGVHIVDAVVSLVGPPAGPAAAQREERFGAAWGRLAWTTAAGCAVAVDLRPTLGCNQEAIELVGEGWRAEARSAWFDAGHTDWHEAGKPLVREVIDPTLPEWRRNGTAAETAAFLAACRGEAPWSPAPAEVLPATRLCHALG